MEFGPLNRVRNLPERAWPVIVLVLAFGVMAVLTPQFVAELDPPTGDEPFYLQMAISLLRDHDVEMTNNYAQRDYLEFYPKVTTRPPFRGLESFPVDLPPHKSATVRPGLFEKHGVGLAVLVAPAYQLGGRLGTVLFMNLLAALLAANMFLMAREISGSLKASLLAAFGLSFSSPLMPYAFLIFPAIPAALMVIYAFRRARLAPCNNIWQLAGAALSLAFLPWLHAGYLWLSIPIFAYFLLQNQPALLARASSCLGALRRMPSDQRPDGTAPGAGRGNLLSIGISLPLVTISAALFLFYYYYLYGTIVPNYGDHAGFSFPLGTLPGAVGLLLDQQWGLVTYSPFYLLPLAGIFLMLQYRRRDALWMLLATVPAFVFFSSYRQWWGEWCPPARYLVPILPLAAAPASLVLREASKSGRALCGILLAVSLFLMGSFFLEPKLMYNHPSGESQLFLAFAGDWGFDVTNWIPSFVNPGPSFVLQGVLAVALATSLVSLLIAFSSRDAGVEDSADQRPRRWFVLRRSQVITVALLGLILMIGAYFRLSVLDWDSGQHLHPDERFITMVATDIKLPSSLGEYFDSASSTLNPNNRNFPSYPYGTSFLFLAKFLSGPTGMEGYDRIVILGRMLSSLADLGTVLLVFFLGLRLYKRWVGLLGAFLYATAVLPIQHSHFFVAESFTTFFVVLTMYMAVRVSSGGGWLNYLGMGVACGLALASKVSVALLIPVMGLAAAMPFWKSRGTRRILGLGIALVAMFLAFRIVQPYAFGGTGFFDLRPSPLFWGGVEEQRRMAEGSVEFPYTLQYFGTMPYLFHLANFFWGLGPALLAAGAGGFALAAYQLWRGLRVEHLLVVVWVGLAFLYFGGQYVKYMRYLLPIYPFMALLAGYLLWWLARAAGEKLRRRKLRLALQVSCVFVVLAGTFLWAWAYTQIYTQPVTRVEASNWIYNNVPAGRSVAVEHWDDPLPMGLRDRNPQQYKQVSLELYNADSPAKVDVLVNQLAQVDYIFISSNRLYGSIPRLPLRYPITTEYYRLLFSGGLGFEPVATFTSYPTLGPFRLVDDKADESFTVYDHPKVLIFKKSPGFSRESVRQALSAVPVDNIVRQGPKTSFNGTLMMSTDLLEANRSGGTWSQIFDPQGLPARFPFVSWYLLVQVLSLAVLPIGMLALGNLPDRGYPLFKSLGILIVAYLSWLAASIRLAPYSRATILGAFVVLAALSALVLWRWGDRLKKTVRENWRVIVATELIFLAAFVVFYLIRMANPDLWHPYRGGEKPMDLAYLNAVVKSTYFPPYDPWFAGGYINYYYFGQVLVATLTKLTAIPTAVTYNLAVPLFFSLTLLGAFSAGYNLVVMGRRRFPFRLALAGGLMAGVFVAIIGNLDGLVQLIDGFWKINPHPIDSSVTGVSGIVNAWGGLVEHVRGKPLPPFDFWRGSRLMTPTFSITEFPFFTFLFADLHAHLVGLPFTLLALGSIFSLTRGPIRLPASRIAQAFVVAVSLGALWAINSWDFPTYFLIAAAVLLMLGMRRPFNWSSLVRNAVMAAGLFLAAYLLYYPFHYYYQQFYAGLNPSPEKTLLHQYLGVHGLFIIIIGAYLLSRLKDGVRRVPGGTSLLAVAGVWLAGLLAILLISKLPTAAFLVLMLALSLLALAAARDRASMLAAVLIIAALALGLGVEFVTIKGDIQRMNTVFKFYLQAWVLMGVASAYCLMVLLRGWRWGRKRWLSYAWIPLVLAGLWGSLLYPVSAVPVRVADRFGPLPPSDNGMIFMRQASYSDDHGQLDLSLDYGAINWMQENIQGSPVLLEGNTPLYRWGSRISIYTGLPTVIGWDWHEKQQRAAYDVMVDARIADVTAMYSTPDAAVLKRLLQKYGVSYVYVGQVERNYYPAAGIAKFASLEGTVLRRVYEDGPVSLYEVANPGL